MAINAEERAALAEAVRDAASAGPRGFLDDQGIPERDHRLWNVLTGQMGLSSLLLPGDDDGAGVLELTVVLESLARTLAVVPALSTLGMAGSLLRVIDTDHALTLLNRLAEEALTATVCWKDSGPALPDSTSVEITASETEPNRVSVSGRVEFVLDGAEADVLLVPGVLDGQLAVVSVDGSEAGVTRTSMAGLDLTRGFAEVEFAHARGELLGTGVPLDVASDLALVCIAAEQAGIAQQCHETAVEWAKERVQFDRPIGQFQAIKHRLVDLLMALELGRSALDAAVTAADTYLDSPSEYAARDLSVAASVAKERCSDAAVLISDESLHILGGIGFTWEHDAHLYFRRSKVLEVFLGNPASHRTRFASILLRDAA